MHDLNYFARNLGNHSRGGVDAKISQRPHRNRNLAVKYVPHHFIDFFLTITTPYVENFNVKNEKTDTNSTSYDIFAHE